MSSFLGVTRQTIHKELKHLEKMNHIVLEYGELIVVDVPALAAIGESHEAP